MKRKRKIKNIRLSFNKIAISIFSILVLLIIFYSNVFKTPHYFPLILTIHSPLNQTYDSSNVTLNVSSNLLAFEIFRSVDNESNMTECMNCTGFTRYNLIFLPGVHNIKVYARNFDNSLAYSFVLFYVKK